MFNELLEKCLDEKERTNSLEGKRVIVRSNEDVPLLIGKVIRYEDFDGKAFEPIPVVVSEEDEREYLCMGIVVEYSDKLFNELEGMKPKEQWEFLQKKRNNQ